MFTAVLVIMTGLFFHDNAEFFAESNKNKEQGYTWEFVGKQKANDYKYSIPVINQETGEEFIYWEQQKPKED